MNKKEQIEISYLINLIQSDINIHENLLKDYEIKAKDSIYYFGLSQEKKDRIIYLKSYLTKLKKIYKEQ